MTLAINSRMLSYKRICTSDKTIFICMSVLITICFSNCSYLFLNLPNDDSSCSLCNFIPRDFEIKSSYRDVVLFSAISDFKRVEYFIRTLKTTRTRARTVLFVDDKTEISDEDANLLSGCNVEVYRYIHGEGEVINKVPKMVRYYYEYDFIKNNINNINRVLHIDSYDVIFGSDPFGEEISDEKLYFTLENIKLKDSKWTLKWMKLCYEHESLLPFYHNEISCSGVIIGSARLYVKYLEILFERSNWTKCYGDSLDQAHHNYIIFTKEYHKSKIEVEFLDCESNYVNLHFCCKRQNCNKIDFTKTDTLPAVVHQYNRFNNIITNLTLLCYSKDLHRNSPIKRKKFTLRKTKVLHAKLPINIIRVN